MIRKNESYNCRAAGLVLIASCLILFSAIVRSEEAAVNPDTVFKEYLGKVLVVEVGQIGCELSGKYLIELKKMYPELQKLGAEVVRIDVNADKEASAVYREKLAIPFKHLGDPDGGNAKKFRARLIPTMVVVDKFGNVRFSGGLKEAELKDLVKQLAAEKEPPAEIISGPAFKPGDVAPDFTAKTIDDEEFILKKAVGASRHVVLFFNSLYCPYSRQALEQFEELVLGCTEDDGITFAVINLQDDVAKIKDTLEIGDPSVLVIPDTGGAIMKKYKVEGAPFAAVIGKDGKLAYYGEYSTSKFMEVLGLEASEAGEDAFQDMFKISGKGLDGQNTDVLELVKKYKAAVIIFAGAEDEIDQVYIKETCGWLNKSGLKEIVVVIVDVSEDDATMKDFYAEEKLQVKVIHDPESIIMEKCEVEITPHYFLISPGGKIAFSGDEMDTAAWKHYLGLLVDGKPLKPFVSEAPQWG